MSRKDRVDPKLLAPGQKPEDVIDYTDEEIKELIEKCYPLAADKFISIVNRTKNPLK
jgi:hypothetical protein